jgi:hypothetical protein
MLLEVFDLEASSDASGPLSHGPIGTPSPYETEMRTCLQMKAPVDTLCYDKPNSRGGLRDAFSLPSTLAPQR